MKQCLRDAESLATHSNRREQLFCIRPADRAMSKLPPETSRPSVYTRPEVHWVYSTTAALATPLLRSLVMHGKGGLFVGIHCSHECLLFIRTRGR